MSHDSEETFKKLLKLAGARDMPSADAMQRARLAAHASWQRGLNGGEGQHPRRRRQWPWALAAAVGLVAVAAVVMSTWLRPPTAAVAQIAEADRGAVLHGPGSTPARATAAVLPGSTLVTSDGRVALTLGGALSLRVDANTRVRFDAVDRITLLEGRLYVDSGGLNAGTPLHIVTRAGELHHLGTQYLVSVNGDSLKVRVREGRVVLQQSGSVPLLDMAAGDEVELAGSHLAWRHGLPAFGEEWEWASRVAPEFAIENRPLAEFLAWLAREHGWQLRYAGDFQQRSHEIRLHGSLDGLDAQGMIERTALITGIPIAQRDGVLLVGKSEDVH